MLKDDSNETRGYGSKADCDMQAIVSDIDQIIENGHGYASGGDVFFDVASMPAYGELSGRKKVSRYC